MKFEICCAVCGIYLGKYVGGEVCLVEFLPVCLTCHSILQEERSKVLS